MKIPFAVQTICLDALRMQNYRVDLFLQGEMLFVSSALPGPSPSVPRCVVLLLLCIIFCCCLFMLTVFSSHWNLPYAGSGTSPSKLCMDSGFMSGLAPWLAYLPFAWLRPPPCFRDSKCRKAGCATHMVSLQCHCPCPPVRGSSLDFCRRLFYFSEGSLIQVWEIDVFVVIVVVVIIFALFIWR